MNVVGIKGLPGLALAYIIYGIPITTQELLEAAKIDGADMLGIYRYILLPISMPSFVYIFLGRYFHGFSKVA